MKTRVHTGAHPISDGSISPEPQAFPEDDGRWQYWRASLVRTDAHRDTLLLLASLLVVAIFLAHGLHQCKELAFSEDEPRHALTGVYFADFLSDLPLSDPVGYTYRYYAQYPALGLVHWPPLYHLSEGVMFLVFGRSVETARLTTMLFALLGLFFWFKIVLRFAGRWAAAFSTIALALLPSIFLYERSVMLEVPSLAIAMAAAYFWFEFLRTGRNSLLYAFAGSAGLAILTKQHSVFLLPLCLLTLVVERKWRLLLRWHAVGAALLSGILVLPYYALTLRVHGASIAEHVVQKRAYTWGDATFYIDLLPRQLGWPLLALSILGVPILLRWGRRQTARMMLLWIIACYLTFTFLRAREGRYIFYWLPPFVYFAAWPLILSLSKRWSRIAALACLLVISHYGWQAWRSAQYPQLSGYSDLARWFSSLPGGRQVILYDGSYNGNFIFQMRVHDPRRRFIVLRKGLYVMHIVKYFGGQQLVKTPEDLQSLLAEYGIRYIVVSDDQDIMWFPVQRMLRDALHHPQFKLVRTFPVEFGDRGESRHAKLFVYENLSAAAPSARYLRVPMLTLERDIVVPLDEIGGR
ncbi:MAG TPA: glycosyltransferase family 39 protein [Terriglobales bacterium]|nr:glycosyltransferase family 39 protein [Terriglobales bacterium]